ncbi:hypothetical protein BZG36_04780 [Bifiguratus adelaidae]|uniref:Cullin family profile domain-containing protein n=1 Tax=Bifiguratus adelaidae TaxID=1938954 RepID=A0A261XWG9_9FUNG|nr:hypothetical protein BZG36_04780 [Bifiguratus adelaidae]
MFTDMTVSADLNTRFKDFLDQSELKLGVGFDILVLTAGAWPLSQSSSTDVQIPAELEKSVTRFTTFYNNHHNGRKLSWLWHLSKGDLRLTYLNKPYELAVSIYQMAILLLFNTNDTLTLQDILDHATLKDTEAKRAIKPLIELKILNCNTTELEPSSDISLNMSFSSKRTKLKPSAAVQSDTPQETTQTHASINQDRNLHLQATIVRLLKSRKRMSHTQLMTDVIDQVKGRFKADVVVVKRCVEVLLEKGYMERDGRDWYVYVA